MLLHSDVIVGYAVHLPLLNAGNCNAAANVERGRPEERMYRDFVIN